MNKQSGTCLFFLYLLATVWRKIEYKNCEERDAHAGDDQIDGVEEGLSTHRDVERDIKVRLITAENSTKLIQSNEVYIWKQVGMIHSKNFQDENLNAYKILF